MSDCVDPTSSSWKVDPAAYFEGREKPFKVMRTPKSTYVAMRDECQLAVDIYLPQKGDNSGDAAGPFPTILISTPYYRRFQTDGTVEESAPQAARYRDMFVPCGYAVVVADVRGTGASFGTRDAFRSPTEREDYRDLAQWIIEQSWSNQIIGATGISYVGAASCFLASTGHPAVKAVAPLFAVSDIYSEQLFPGGLCAKIWTENYDSLMVAMDQDRRDLIKSFSYYTDPGLQGPHPVDGDADRELLSKAIEQHRSSFRLNDLASELAFRGEGLLHEPELSLATCSPYHYVEAIPDDVAVYSISGWYDGTGYANGAISRYLTRNNPRDRLLLGPWDHGARTNGSPWRDQIAPEFDFMSEVLRFFDTHLMHRETGLDDEAPIHYFNVHGEKWRSAREWPPTNAARTWAATPAGQLIRDAEANAPSPAEHTRAATAGVREFTADFLATTGRNTRSERLGAQSVETYYLDWQDNESGMLKFDTEPLGESLSFAGHAVATLKVSVDQGDASVFVYLSEVDANGVVHYITEGLLRALHRKTTPCPSNYVTTWPFRSYSREDAEAMPLGEAQELVIPLLPTCWTLSAGSKLRLSISGADAAHYTPQPYGRPPRFTVHMGESGTVLTLPIIGS